MEFAFWYLVGIVVMFAVSAWRIEHHEVRAIFYLSLLWPVSVILITGTIVADKLNYKPKWSFNAGYNPKFFAFRKPDDGQPGFAITVFKIEFQFWKTRDFQV